jgi:2-polyprenyl-3-methyl-5-hydroxy-6-metoxy-1,4-benzoquinol methylase/uncharacterized protein YbaR (Trm112 family)
MRSFLKSVLGCPRDKSGLKFDGSTCSCEFGHSYPVVAGVPVLLVEDVPQTIGIAQASIRAARSPQKTSTEDETQYYLETLGISEKERTGIRGDVQRGNSEIDPVVKYLVAATNGILYKPMLGTLASYPIPSLPLEAGNGKILVDIGCSWGRWSIAAARKGYNVIGIDPSLGAILAARRVSKQLGCEADFIVADARFPPLRAKSVDIAFSYSVLQHFSKADVRSTLAELRRILVPRGGSVIQMANAFGIRSMQNQLRRGFREPTDFNVRFWRPTELQSTFSALLGDTEISVDGYFGLGIQASDSSLLPFRYRVIVRASEVIKRLSRKVKWVRFLADSVYLHSVVDDSRLLEEAT